MAHATYYGAAAAENPQNSWLKCAATVSNIICQAAAAQSAIPGAANKKASWLYCINKCIFKKWLSGYGSAYPSSSLPDKSGLELDPPTQTWKDASDCIRKGLCDGSAKGDCCKKQVEAEQTAIEECKEDCGKYKTADWGDPFDVPGPDWLQGIADLGQQMEGIGIELPQNFEGDFNNLNDRIKYGEEACGCNKK